MGLMRAVFAILLALGLTLTGGTMAVTHGRMAGAEVMVLCLGHEAKPVLIDAMGEAIEDPTACHGCVLAYLDQGDSAPWQRPEGALVAHPYIFAAHSLRQPAPQGAQARGPPIWG